AGLGEALEGMVRSGEAEGRHLSAIVLEQVAAIERLVARVAASPSRSPEAIRQRLKEQVERLIETGATLDEGRLYQEAALLATRADVEEELKRLGAHIASARELIASNAPAGTRLNSCARRLH